MLRTLALLLISVSVAACAITTSYGNRLESIPGEDNRYSLQIYKNAFASYEDVDEKAKEMITEYMESNGFEDFEILNVTRGADATYDVYTIELHKNKPERELAKFNRKQEGDSQGPISFTDDNPNFTELARGNKRLTLIVDFTVVHFDANARGGEDAIIDLPESRAAVHALASTFSELLEEAGYEITKTIHSSGMNMKPLSYRIRRTIADRSIPAKNLSRQGMPFYLDETSFEDSLRTIYRDAVMSTDVVFTDAAALARKNASNALIMIVGYAQIPTEGRAVLGVLDLLSGGSTYMLSLPTVQVGVQVIDANNGKQIGVARRSQSLADSTVKESLVGMAGKILEEYPEGSVQTR